MSAPKFQFYEKVRVVSDDPEVAEVNGEIGSVLGRSQDDEGRFEYGVFIYRDEICWSLPEEDLEATGEYDVRESFYDDTVIRVRVDEQGRGWLAD